MQESNRSRRVIEVNKHIIGPREPQRQTVQAKRLEDYRGVSAVHLDAAKRLSSPLLLGPPICDELIALVCHLFTEEEAALVRHLSGLSGSTAADLARAQRQPLEDVQPILDRLALQKRAIASSGPENRQRYRLLPIMPGIFEMVLIGEGPETMSAWHHRFAELFEALYETGYIVDYQEGQTRPSPFVRVLTVGRTIEAHPMALPSDHLPVILDRFDAFGIGQCQCRTAMQVAGQGCGKPLGNCTVMGQWAEQGIQQGWLQQVTKQNVLEIKREAESHGLVTWIMNVESAKGQASCSCCGCCCHAMRTVNQFNAPGVIAPAHFLPQVDLALCSFCGKCARNCPMGAIAVDTRAKTYRHLTERCIGCGLCLLACDGSQRAISLEPVPDYKLPYRSWFSLLAHEAPGMLKTVWNVWRKYR